MLRHLTALALAFLAGPARAAVLVDSEQPEVAVSTEAAPAAPVSTEAAKPAAPAPRKPGLYAIGMEQRSRGELHAARETFRKMLEEDPKSGGGLEGLGLVSLSLRDYETARRCFSEWNKLKPGSAYILWFLHRADSALGRDDDVLSDLRELTRADPMDLPPWRRLDDRLRLRDSAQLDGRMYKSIGTEGLETNNPQRIAYSGRSGALRGVYRVHPKFDVTGGYSVREEAQHNDTRGFTYYDIIEQTALLGARGRPAKSVDLEAEYGQSLLYDSRGDGLGRKTFSRARLSGEWRAPWATMRLRAGRAPYYLRGVAGSSYFSLVREAYGSGEAEKSVAGLTWTLRAGLTGYSERTTLRTAGLRALKEFGDRQIVKAGWARGYQEYSGASDEGRLRMAAYHEGSIYYRYLRDSYFRAEAGYSYAAFDNGDGLHTLEVGAEAWLPFARSLSLAYRAEWRDWKYPISGLRSSDSTEHWLGPHWRKMLLGGLWTHLAYEHGWELDSRAGYEGDALLGEAEWYLRDRLSVKLLGRVSQSALHDESYSLGLSARVSF